MPDQGRSSIKILLTSVDRAFPQVVVAWEEGGFWWKRIEVMDV